MTTHAPFPDLSAHRVLVAEDDPQVAELWDIVLRECRAKVVGPFASGKAALHALEGETPSLGLLDVNLDDGTSQGLAEALEVRGVPFLCVTSHDQCDLVGALHRAPHLNKPVSLAVMLQRLAALSV